MNLEDEREMRRLQGVLCEAFTPPYMGMGGCPCGTILQLLVGGRLCEFPNFLHHLDASHLPALRALAGPHGDTIFKVMKIRCEKVL